MPIVQVVLRVGCARPSVHLGRLGWTTWLPKHEHQKQEGTASNKATHDDTVPSPSAPDQTDHAVQAGDLHSRISQTRRYVGEHAPL